MAAGGPVLNMIRAPWYGSSTLAGLILGSNLLLLLTAVSGWIYASLGRAIRKEKSSAPKLANAARVMTATCCLLLLVLIFGLVGLFSDIHPAFGVPRFFIEGLQALNAILIIPYLVLVASAAMLVFTFLAWKNKYWTKGARIHYTLLTLSSLGFIWLMCYVNFL